jgi:predicted 3-demethylubiquinone-9 3-methyltransferase (glyoxalase superfamily)
VILVTNRKHSEEETVMQKIGPCLWFDGQAEEAAAFYVATFKNSRIVETTHYFEGSHRPVGSVMTVRFIIDGEEFVALNAGPQFTFSPAISFMVKCNDQNEIDTLWEKLLVGGREVECGWLTDRFGVSWQIVPNDVLEMFASSDTAAAKRAFNAMVKMKKLDIAVLKKAYNDE